MKIAVKARNDFVKGLSNFSIWLVLVLFMCVMALSSDVFLSGSNIINILRQAVIVGVMAVGMTYAMIAGNFDLSVGATMGLGAVISITMQPNTAQGTFYAVLLPLLAGICVGVVNGALIGYLKMNPFITTLGMQFAVSGLTMLYTGGGHVWVFEITPFYETIGNGFFGPLPVSVIILIVVVLVGQIVLSYTNFGQYVKYVGANGSAAKLSGINTERVTMITFIIIGLCGALSGIVLASWVKNMDPGLGVGYEFEVITAVVLGGTSLLGGRGNILNSIAGVLILVIVVNAMTLLNISYNYQLMIRGIILIISVSLEIFTRRSSS